MARYKEAEEKNDFLCPRCKGARQVETILPDGSQGYEPCPDCFGDGRVTAAKSRRILEALEKEATDNEKKHRRAEKYADRSATKVEANVECPNCKGDGEINVSGVLKLKCTLCGGTGTVAASTSKMWRSAKVSP